MPLLDLPEELLCSISAHCETLPFSFPALNEDDNVRAWNLSSRTCYTTLLSACLASQTLCRAARPSLYRCVDMRTAKSRRSFVRTITHDSSLAPHVRELVLGNWFEQDQDNDLNLAGDLESSLRPVENPSTLEIGAATQNISSGPNRNEEIILARCSKLESLVFEARFTPNEALKPSFFLMNSSSNLRSVQVLDGFHLYTEHGSLLPILRLPKLYRFCGEDIDLTGRELPPFDTLSTVRVLRLANTYICANGLHNLLRNCPALTGFFIEYGEVGYGDRFDFADLDGPVGKYNPSLQSLEISIAPIVFAGKELTPLGSLASLKDLQVLAVPLGALYMFNSEKNIPLIDAPPRSIKVLKVGYSEDEDDEDDAVWGILDQQLGTLLGSRQHSNLHTVRMHRLCSPFDEGNLLLPKEWACCREGEWFVLHRSILD